MTDLVQFGMILLATLLATLLAFVAGHATARHSSSVRLVDKWPHAHIQFDSGMSQEEVLRFLDMTREMVLTGELAKPKKTEDRATELCRSIRPSIVLELREDGLAVISGWIGGRHDSTYRPMHVLVELDIHHRLTSPFDAVEGQTAEAYARVFWQRTQRIEQGL